MSENYLAHYGVKRRSGRYPYGSGEIPYQHEPWFQFLNDMNKVKAKYPGISEVDLAKKLGFNNTADLRAQHSLSTDQKRAWDAATVRSLWNDGIRNKSEIARRIGISEGTVRSIVNNDFKVKEDSMMTLITCLKDNVDKKGMVDVGIGVEQQLGVPQAKLKAVVTNLCRDKQYVSKEIYVEQLGTGKNTTMKIVMPNKPPYTDRGYAYNHRDEIKMINEANLSADGKKLEKVPPLKNIDYSRVQVTYAENGGGDKDGLIELRRGVPELNLEGAKYAQVRIGVDAGKEGKYFLKGVAMYTDDLPKGVDIRYNTSKHQEKGPFKAMKEQEGTAENPFKGAAIRPKIYHDENGKVHRSLLNVVNEEGDWGKWSSTIAAQMLSKQPKEMIEYQLKLTIEKKEKQFAEIMSLTNPEVKKKLLIDFADECDSGAVKLKAEGIPRQSWNIILPFPNMKEDQIYAPHYKDGEKLALIRYPHSGIFEIPVLTVNNKFQEAKDKIFNAKDAVGIHPKVAQQLSGADFDGDTALCIPISKTYNIQHAPYLEPLKNFDNKESYPYFPGMKVMTSQERGIQMGKVTNLITDMTMIGCEEQEMVRAVKQSMVVIDAKKHKLDWRRSEKELNIEQLYEKYQGNKRGGAGTIISRSRSPYHVPERRAGHEYDIDPKTGKKIWNYTGKQQERWDPILKKKVPTGKLKTFESTKMYETDNAETLMSNRKYEKEQLYANYANSLKGLGNRARLAYTKVKDTAYNPNAARVYAKEVSSVEAKLKIAQYNAPYERLAQVVGGKMLAECKKANGGDMDYDDLKKKRGQFLKIAREQVGAKKKPIDFTDREWEAVQAGSFKKTKLETILKNCDSDKLKERALPKPEGYKLTDSEKQRIKSYYRLGLSIADIADRLGVSTSTIDNYVG